MGWYKTAIRSRCINHTIKDTVMHTIKDTKKTTLSIFDSIPRTKARSILGIEAA